MTVKWFIFEKKEFYGRHVVKTWYISNGEKEAISCGTIKSIAEDVMGLLNNNMCSDPKEAIVIAARRIDDTSEDF